MNFRSLLFCAALVAAFLGFAFGAVALAPRPHVNPRAASNGSGSLIFVPLVALPLVHALLSP
jgi:hypothetical protein